MKQSTKLLSLVLALVMAFSCMTVIGNAALVKGEVKWDIIDDADLSPEQVADLALDLVDNDLLAGMETIDLSIVGKLRLDSVDHIAKDIDKLTSGFVWAIGKGLLGDVGDMNFDAIAGKQRSGGDLNFIYGLLQFLADNAGIVSKVAYGIGTNKGISLGIIGNFLDLGDIGDMLGNIPLMLTEMVYDLLIHGSYGYNDSVDDLKAAGKSLPTDMDTLDEIANNALLNLVINPQDYEYEGEGESAVKVWDMGSILSPSLKAYTEKNGRDSVIAEFSPLSNSLFTILDFVAPYAINDIAINALNNNLKKALMLAVEAELSEIDVTALPADVNTAFETDKAEADKSYVTYFAYDKLAKSGNTWFYTTLETEVEEDANGDPVLDEEGNEVTTKTRKYFKVNMAVANDFAKLINWDWEFVGTDAGYADAAAAKEAGKILLSYEDLTAGGSIASGINDLIGLVYENGLTDAAKAEFEGFLGVESGEGWLPGNENINENVKNVTKYILVNFGDMVFGSDSAYANLEWEAIADYEIIDLVALIGPEFFEDAMPQIILPKDADGKYAFHQGVQVWEFAAIVIRELITGIAPNVNYDAYIFENGDVTSANDRLFVEQDAEDWFNILLNMGTDLAIEYLINITNFRDFCREEYGTDFDLDAYISTGGADPAHWQKTLDAAILWAVEYVGSQKSSSVLKGLDYNTIKAVNGPFNKLNTILNTLLPLGFIQGYQGDVIVNGETKLGLDVAALVDGIKELLTTFDLNCIINLFGRDGGAYNFLEDVPLVQGVLDLANSILNLVFRANILQGTNSGSLDTVVSQANLKTTVETLLNQLNSSKEALLLNALPVVGKLIKGWGTEQSFNTPDISLSRTIDLTNGATTEAQTVTIRNASDGVWRHYRDAAGNVYKDNQYEIKPTKVEVFDQLGETDASAYVTTAGLTTTSIGYGASGSFTYTAANVPAEGALVRFVVSYQVYDEDGKLMAGGKEFKTAAYAWLNYNGSNEDKWIEWNNDGSLSYANMKPNHYVPLSSAADYIPQMVTGSFGRDYKLFTSSQEAAITAATATIDGLTFGSVSMKFSNSSKGRYFNDLTQFKTYKVQATNEDGEVQTSSGDSLQVNGSVNAAAWKAANKTSGSKTTFSITLKAKGKNNGPHNLVLNYYDDIYQSRLASLAGNEMDTMRLESTYNITGTAYANGLLTTSNTTDDEGETIFRESNFTTTAWIAQEDCGKWSGTGANGYTNTVTEYAEASVQNIVEETDEDDNVVGATGYVMSGEEKIAVRKVTKIDCATAINAYVPAFINGAKAGFQAWNENAVYDFEARYEALYVTSNDVSYCAKSTDQLVAEGQGDNTSAAIEALEANLQAIEEEYIYDYDFTDYKMYRLNRLNDARDDAHWLLQLVDDAKPATVAEIDEYFDYNWMEENDFCELVKGDEYEAYLLALLEKFDDEEIKAKAEWLNDRKLELARQTLLDIEMMDNLLTRTSQRLLDRAYKVDGAAIDRQLVDEIASANNMIGTDASKYTEKSWARYQEALTYANDVVNANGVVKSQKHVFEAKYNLLIARKALVPAGMEADYTELNALIAQAEAALANAGSYNNTNKELGQVLAELGYDEINNVQLFPGSAYLTLAEGYSVEDQDKVDDAANALKEALARLKFKGTQVKGADVKNEVLVKGDEEAGIEAITADVARINPLLNAGAVKVLFSATTATNATVTPDLINVSNDTIYTIDTDLDGFVGTDSSVTFYTLVGGVKIPVATVKIVVEGDVNGDGVVNVIDASLVEVASNEHSELVGCFFLAADIDPASKDEIVADDYSAVLNAALKA